MAGILNKLWKLPSRKSVYQPKLASGQKQLPAKFWCKPTAAVSQKMAASKKWLWAKTADSQGESTRIAI